MSDTLYHSCKALIAIETISIPLGICVSHGIFTLQLMKHSRALISFYYSSRRPSSLWALGSQKACHEDSLVNFCDDVWVLLCPHSVTIEVYPWCAFTSAEGTAHTEMEDSECISAVWLAFLRNPTQIWSRPWSLDLASEYKHLREIEVTCH